jgi:sensor histidine kinase regulating citrate/malate metabolism
MDRLLPIHEPVITGWFHEWASFLLILCIGIAVGVEVAAQYKNSAVQSERARNLEHLYKTQQSYFSVLDEKMEVTQILRHDLRHHVSILDGLIAEKQYDQLEMYLSGFKQDINMSAAKVHSKNKVVNVLANHYESLAVRQGVKFDLRCDLEGDITIPAADFSALLSNLIENALEACMRLAVNTTNEHFIKVAIAQMGSAIYISVINSADAGIIPVDNNRFASSKAEGRIGYGLHSVSLITKKYNGQSEISWDEANQIFTHSVTLFFT